MITAPGTCGGPTGNLSLYANLVAVEGYVVLYVLRGNFGFRVIPGGVLDPLTASFDGVVARVALLRAVGECVALPQKIQVHRLRREVVVALNYLGVITLRQDNTV